MGKPILGCMSSLMYLVQMESRFRNAVVSMSSAPACIAETDWTSLNLCTWPVSSSYICLDVTQLSVMISLEQWRTLLNRRCRFGHIVIA
jgi:hypothetical protein